MMMLLIVWNLLRLDDNVFFTSSTFSSSFVSNLLYLICVVRWQSMFPTLLDKDFKEGQGHDMPVTKVTSEILIRPTCYLVRNILTRLMMNIVRLFNKTAN